MQPHTILSHLALAVAILPVAVAAQAKPSFDCAKAQSRVEKTICASAPLAKADAEIAALYQERMRALAPEAAARLQRDEKRFLASRERAFEIDEPTKVLLGEIEGRADFLRRLRVPVHDDLVGAWSNLSGVLTIRRIADGSLTVDISAAQPVTARWVCSAGGEGRISDGRLEIRIVEDGSSLRFRRDGQTLEVEALPPPNNEAWTPGYCGLNGSVDGTYFEVDQPGKGQ